MRLVAAIALIVLGAAAAFFRYARAKAPRRERIYLMVMPFAPVTGVDESLSAGISEFVTAWLSTIRGISVLPDPRALGRVSAQTSCSSAACSATAIRSESSSRDDRRQASDRRFIHARVGQAALAARHGGARARSREVRRAALA